MLFICLGYQSCLFSHRNFKKVQHVGKLFVALKIISLQQLSKQAEKYESFIPLQLFHSMVSPAASGLLQ